MLKIRRSWHRLIFNMGIPILVRRYLYIEPGPLVNEKIVCLSLGHFPYIAYTYLKMINRYGCLKMDNLAVTPGCQNTKCFQYVYIWINVIVCNVKAIWGQRHSSCFSYCMLSSSEIIFYIIQISIDTFMSLWQALAYSITWRTGEIWQLKNFSTQGSTPRASKIARRSSEFWQIFLRNCIVCFENSKLEKSNKRKILETLTFSSDTPSTGHSWHYRLLSSEYQ